MFYVVHMSTKGEDEYGNGGFTGVTEAQSPEEAVEKLQDKVCQLHEDESTDIFDEVGQVYVDDIIELDSVPNSPVICSARFGAGFRQPSVGYELPEGETEAVRSWELGEEEAEGEHAPCLEFE